MNGNESQERRTALAAFLTQRRKQLLRDRVNLPPGPRDRRIGLSREEVSYHASVSMTWYTWLEQARTIKPSREVLLSIANALTLNEQERAYVLHLAGYSGIARQGRDRSVSNLPESVQQLMDSINPNPAYAIFTDWFFAGWNSAYLSMFPRVAAVPAEERNLISMVFNEDSVRLLMPDWETDSHRFLAQFRAEAAPYFGQPEVAYLVDELFENSREFRAGWNSKDLELFSARPRRFNHPVCGNLLLHQHRLSPPEHPDILIVVYTPCDSETADKLRVDPK